MAFNDNQSDTALPVGANQSKRTSADHLPKYFRTESNKKFLSATLDQLLNPGVAEKISAYYGRRIAKARVASDNYIGTHILIGISLLTTENIIGYQTVQ